MTGNYNTAVNNLTFDTDMEYEAVIGLEVHVQLDTNSKMFTRVGTGFGKPPNTLTNPVVLGLPGALPVMNREAIEKSIKVGLLLNCKIAEVCKWDRKNYFYPDMPKIINTEASETEINGWLGKNTTHITTKLPCENYKC